MLTNIKFHLKYLSTGIMKCCNILQFSSGLSRPGIMMPGPGTRPRPGGGIILSYTGKGIFFN